MTPPTEMPIACAACTTILQGTFCHHCGARQQAGQLTMNALLRDLRCRLLDWEQGFFRTVWHLLSQPNAMLTNVLAGQRKGYNHSVTFLLICATLSLLAAQLYDEAFWQFFRDAMLQGVQASGKSGFGAAEVNRFVDVHAATMAILPYWLLLLSLPAAWFMRWFFPRCGHTVAEYWLMSLYAIGLALLIDAVLCTVATVTQIDPNFQLRQLSAGVLILLSVGFVGRAWLRGGLWTLLRLWSAMLLAVLLSAMVQQGVAFGYAYWGGYLVQ